MENKEFIVIKGRSQSDCYKQAANYRGYSPKMGGSIAGTVFLILKKIIKFGTLPALVYWIFFA